ncbi:MAG TPA: hypothetical protein VJ951_00485, partial [Bacteroidales bacterium]|nr:hypothetical protein [Bacteroidales bacterium]
MKQQVLWTLIFLLTSIVNVTAQVVYPEGTIADSSTVDSTDLLRVKPVNVATDIIVLHSGEKLYVDVKKIQFNDLFYTFPKDPDILQMDKRLVKKVYYKSGKIETLSQADEEIPEVGDYR